MKKWNEQAAPNNNLSDSTLQNSKFTKANNENNHPFSEELSDSGERDDIINKQLKEHQPGM